MNQQLAPIEEVRHTLGHLKSKITATLPKGIDFDRFARHVMLSIERDPALLRVDRNSLYSAISQASASGLVPDGKEGALTIFANSVVWMPMTKGLLKLVHQTGELKSLSVNVVREGDQFDYYLDDEGEHVIHRPKIGSKEPMIAAYALLTTTKGGVYAEVMSAEEIEKVRMTSRSGAKGRGPWKEWFEEMVKKTVLRRLMKRVPSSSDKLNQAVESVDSMYDFDQPKAVEGKPQARAGRPAVFDAIQQEDSQ